MRKQVMKISKNLLPLLCLLSLIAPIIGCGNGGSSDDHKPVTVTDIFTDDPSVVVGDDVDLTVQFSFANEAVVDNHHTVVVVVRVPNGLTFENGTARIDEIGGNDKVIPGIEVCGNGDTFLTFVLEKNVLENASDPDGSADAKLIMALRGTHSARVIIDAEAGYDEIAGSCTNGIIPQKSEAFVIL